MNSNQKASTTTTDHSNQIDDQEALFTARNLSEESDKSTGEITASALGTGFEDNDIECATEEEENGRGKAMTKSSLRSLSDNKLTFVNCNYSKTADSTSTKTTTRKQQQQQQGTPAASIHPIMRASSIMSLPPELPPALTPYSAISKSPGYWTWYRPLGLLFATLMAVIFLTFITILSPIVLVFIIIQKVRAISRKPHTDPRDVKVAIIGAGWTGMQVMLRLREYGVQVQGYEKWNDCGGCWHPNGSYHGMQLHAPMFVNSFDNHKYEEHDKEKINGKLNGAEFHKYMRDVMEKEDLRRLYKFNADVMSLHYNSETKKATIDVSDENDVISTDGPFDLVLYTGFTTRPKVPNFPGQENFEGTILHAQQLDEETFYDILDTKKKVAVLGGNKSAADMVLLFQRKGYEGFNWIYRNAYLLAKMEVVVGPKSATRAFLGMLHLLVILVSGLSMRFARFLMWCIGSAWTFDSSGSMKPEKFNFGCLCPIQRKDLEKVDRSRMFKADIDTLEPKGIKLTNGKLLEADVLLLGTGSTSGMGDLSLIKDGKDYTLEGSKKILNYMFLRDFPALALSYLTFFDFGPMRGIYVADLAMYHLCVQKKDLTEKQINSISRWQFGSSQDPTLTMIEDPLTPLAALCLVNVGLVLTGLVDFVSFLNHAVSVLCLGKQIPVNFHVLSNLKKVKPGDQR
eukprot:CAMPEP_0118718030 /NCGR_PEP_ID=MMETSP0800-20121206/28554_1 /TAXON_ID=210618 ORGANISM="Striatella unipunctata, Strain CCMP2910" /NCGR_SAMPLE_ID=MMETSP0800 /ASSEMBLY_ACC=CAM_ASM_000638 /LENGTH=683 /DNA_ID=CAMNT_0006624965 /DNA_START=194 /DNA_END=2245 /DNA_ORIENTATION=-